MATLHYTSIERIPIYNYWHAQEDLRFLFEGVEVREDIDKHKMPKALLIAWDDLKWQYLASFGVGDNMAQVYDLQKQIMVHQAKLNAGDKIQLTFIRLKEHKIKELVKAMGTESPTLEEAIASVEEHRKVSVDAHTTTAKQFFTYMDRLKDYNKKQTAAINRMKNKGKK